MQMLRDLMTNYTGQAMKCKEHKARKQFEGQHSPHDDYTDVYVRNAVGTKATYNDHVGLPTDRDMTSRLIDLGLPLKDANALEAAGCERISDVRSAAISDTEIPGYPGLGLSALAYVRAVLEKLDEERRRERDRKRTPQRRS